MLKGIRTKKRVITVTGGLLGALCALGLTSAPMAQASTGAALTCKVVDTGGPGSRPEGYGDARVCDGNITGTVHDTKADGRCPYVRIFFNDGGWWESPWAGGNGKSVNFSGFHSGVPTSAVLDYIFC
ncbi:hypothetical protein PZB75_30095 [Streptomyces sp. AM 4-1-1]|uniref:hypothetical protein n=1 Tax=Streptomyces sp. AM 4-1-1 TaxID=3028710 RepID=UPI0023B9C602|nr:hypothetical protein [Streptomyces sp. AM 4-1-1]WEH37245.1 hypothetical protein PZB75_30095 [Streptomyces sp. AM 4-1-1]